MKPLRPLVLSLLALAAAAYVGGIAWAGIASLGSPDEPPLPEIVTYAITAIGGLLATHFGAALGISQFSGGTRGPDLRFWRWARLPERAGAAADMLDWLQIAAAYLYAISLLGAFVFWAIDGLSPTSARTLVNMSFTLIGVFVGIGAVALNVKK